ncbi:sugar phosphate isomerase/epimerase [Rubripirellula sp.]|nr:sugar phosphate isomerase/epimerase [Rubripirellula sp.]
MIRKTKTQYRRTFLGQSGLTLGSLLLASNSQLRAGGIFRREREAFQISLAQWTLVRELKSGKIDNLDFAKVASDHGIGAIEYVNQFFMDKATDKNYLAEMKKRADDLSVTSVLIMCDNEGNLGDPDESKRKTAVENHRKWIDAANALGCHAIRVNARSGGSWDEQVKLAADGLRSLCEIGEQENIHVIVENHGGLSSNADWLLEVMETVNHSKCGTLPDTGNFRINNEETYDSYLGVKKLMPWAKGVSIKDKVWDANGNQSDLDFTRMMQIVVNAGYRGHCGIEFGGLEGLNAARESLEIARDQIELPRSEKPIADAIDRLRPRRKSNRRSES